MQGQEIEDKAIRANINNSQQDVRTACTSTHAYNQEKDVSFINRSNVDQKDKQGKTDTEELF